MGQRGRGGGGGRTRRSHVAPSARTTVLACRARPRAVVDSDAYDSDASLDSGAADYVANVAAQGAAEKAAPKSAVGEPHMDDLAEEEVEREEERGKDRDGEVQQVGEQDLDIPPELLMFRHVFSAHEPDHGVMALAEDDGNDDQEDDDDDDNDDDDNDDNDDDDEFLDDTSGEESDEGPNRPSSHGCVRTQDADSELTGAMDEDLHDLLSSQSAYALYVKDREEAGATAEQVVRFILGRRLSSSTNAAAQTTLANIRLTLPVSSPRCTLAVLSTARLADHRIQIARAGEVGHRA
jgi:hypothetical protein